MSGDSIKRDYRFTTLPEHLIRDRSISDRAVRLWCILDRYAGADGAAFPTRETLSKDLDCSRASIDRALTELVDGGWLHKARREAGGQNDYTLLIAKVSKIGKRSQVSRPRVVTSDDTPPALTGEDTPGSTGEDTLDSPATQGVITGAAHKEASGSEESKKGDTAAEAAERRDLNEGREDVDRICEHFSQRLTELGVLHTVSKAWRDAARLMLDTDKRGEDKVHVAIDWTFRDAFWHRNIHSLPTLREKYDRLRLDAQQQGRPTIGTRASDPGNHDRIAGAFQ